MDERERRLTQEPQTLKMIREGLLRMTKTEFAQALGRHRSRATQWEHAERPQLMGEETRLDLARLIAARFSSQEKLRDYLEEVGWTFGPEEWAVAQVHLQRDEYLAGMPRVRPSEFVGRDRELQALRRAVLETGATSPLILLIEGMPGVGKTTLAARLWADREVRNRFEDGIIWIGVEAESPDDERADLEERALRALLDQVLPEAELSGRYLSVRRKVRRALEGQRRLMIFDGADQRIDLDQWMMVDPVFGRLVVTTRRRDLVSRKWKGRVWSTELEALEPPAARTLLTRGIERVDVKERDLDQILEKLGGVALALDIANRLAQQSGFKYLFRGLDADPIGALELYDPVRKEESIRWAFGLSYRSLDHDGKRLFQALSLSPRPFAAGAFARVLDWDERRIGQAFHALTCVGLVERREAGYWTHSLLHDYARELARGLPGKQMAAWKRRFAAHYLDVTQRAADRWRAGAKKEAVRLWDREMAHIDQGCAYAAELGRHDDVMAYWWATILYFINVGASREMVDRWRSHFNTAARDDEWAHGNLVLGMLYTYLNQPDRAVYHFTEAREAVGRTQEELLWLEITQRMGQAFLAGGRLEDALALVNDQDYISARNRLPEDSPLFIMSLLFEAQIHQMTRNYFDAQECLVVAVELAKDVLDPLTQSDVLLRLSDVLGHLNRWERVVEVSREGMRLGDMDAARPVWSLHAMSEITALLELGRMAEAAGRLEQVEAVVRSDPWLESAWLVEYAQLLGERGDWDAAEAAYGEAIEKAYGTLPEADIRFRLGMHLKERGEAERAVGVLRETRERARQLGNTSKHLMATYHCAEFLMELGQEDEARALAEELLEQWNGDGLAVGALEILGREEEAAELENRIARRELEQMSRLTEVEKSGRWRDLL